MELELFSRYIGQRFQNTIKVPVLCGVDFFPIIRIGNFYVKKIHILHLECRKILMNEGALRRQLCPSRGTSCNLN